MDPAHPRWLECVFTVAATELEAVETRLALAGCREFWRAEPLAHERGDEGWHTAPDPTAAVEVHVCVADAAEAERLEAIVGDWARTYRRQWIEPRDWLEEWRAERDIVGLDDGWSIAPPWLADQAPDPRRTILIDPGLAFGVGNHPTTRDSARLVLQAVRPGDRVLDLGTGSGVLGLLALKAGAASVLGLEVDPLAAAEAERNATLNGLAGFTVVAADAADYPYRDQFDLLLINIGTRLAKDLAPLAERLAGPAARLIVSGLTEWTEAAVREVYAGLGWSPVDRLQDGSEWVSLRFERRCRPGRPILNCSSDHALPDTA